MCCISINNKFMNKHTQKMLEKRNTTRKINILKILPKCPRSRITGMESYKINCGKNLLIGYNTIKASEETSIHKDDFVHVVLSKLHDYDEPVVVKVYDEYNFHLHIEMNILKKIDGFRNAPQLICDFSCNDDKNKYITKIRNQTRFCGNGSHKLHFFVYEYISHGDVSDFLTSNTVHIDTIKNLILQLTCVIMQLASVYRIYHGDINSGNILIDSTNEKNVDYCIDGETFVIESHGIMPKLIDYGRSNFYNSGNIPNQHVWFDIIMMLGVIYPYIQNNDLKPMKNFTRLADSYSPGSVTDKEINLHRLKQQILDMSKKTELHLSSLPDYFIYMRNVLCN